MDDRAPTIAVKLDQGKHGRLNLYLQVLILLLPVITSLIVYGGSVTQDGPAHLASAKIANEYLAGLPTVRSVYQVQFLPIPNWAGQLMGMFLVKTFPVLWANRLMNMAGLVLPAMGLVWLVRSIRRDTIVGTWPMAFWISILSMNVVWTFGFTSFLVGLGLAWVQLGLVWRFRDSKSVPLAIALATGWCILFLSHLVAFAVAGLIFGCVIFLTGGIRFSARCRHSLLTLPSLILLLNYKRMSSGSKLELIWEHWQWSQWYSPENWARQAGWVDPISLASKRWVPGLEIEHAAGLFLQPVFWLALGLSGLLWATVFGRTRINQDLIQLRGWLAAIVILGVLGFLGPDTLGRDQGHYLQQRILLSALSLLILAWPGRLNQWSVRAMILAWLLQSVSVISFVRKSDSLTRKMEGSYVSVESGKRIVALVDAKPWAYRANPRLHLDSILVFGADDVASWNLYEASHLYFPVVFRDSPEGIDAQSLEKISLLRGDDQEVERQDLVISALNSAMKHAETVFVIGSEDSDLVHFVKDSVVKWGGLKLKYIYVD